jgi:hypothetical protein
MRPKKSKKSTAVNRIDLIFFVPELESSLVGPNNEKKIFRASAL